MHPSNTFYLFFRTIEWQYFLFFPSLEVGNIVDVGEGWGQQNQGPHKVAKALGTPLTTTKIEDEESYTRHQVVPVLRRLAELFQERKLHPPRLFSQKTNTGRCER